MKDYEVTVKQGISKSGNPYKYVECAIFTALGTYTFRGFPSSLEIGIIEKTLAKTKEIYSEENSDNLF